jgi:hypothetical protein
MNLNVNTQSDLMNLIESNTVYEVDSLELYFADYLSVPRAERVNIYYNMLNIDMNLNEFELKYGSYLMGYNIKFKNKKICTGQENIRLTYSSNVCFFYAEYRIVFLLDISQSLFIYDFHSQMINIEKLEVYLKSTVKELLRFKKVIKTFKKDENEKLYSPKLILSFVTMGSEEDCGILSHEIYLDNSNFEEYFEIVMKKLKHAIVHFPNLKKTKESTPYLHFYNNRIYTSYLNKMLDQSLYILDLLPRSATPLLIMFTDSNLCLAQMGNYNDILMQYNRIDINVHIIDLYSSNSELNQFYFGYINNETIMEHICKFTGGSYLNEQKLSQILKIKINRSESKNILNFNNPKPSENNFNENYLSSISQSPQSNKHYSKCSKCNTSADLFFCKKPYQEKSPNFSFLRVNNDILDQVKKSINELGFNFSAIDGFKITQGIKVYQKETFERYDLLTPVQRITECRIRESFKMMKTTNVNSNDRKKIKFNITLLPEISVCYIVKSKNEKSFSQNNYENEKSIRIKIVAPFYIFNYLKLEYMKNRATIEKNQNLNSQKKNQTSQISNLTDIEKILKFIKEVMYTDKLLSTFCNAFTIDKEFGHKENGERENFLNNNKSLWDLLGNLSLHTWHRFFNVETLELMVNNKNVNLEEVMKNFYSFEENQKINSNFIKTPTSNSNKLATPGLSITISPSSTSSNTVGYNLTKSKSICEKILFNFCDKTKSEFGIKLIHKTVNNSNKRFMNGFCLVRIVWIYENVGLVYLAFFQTFIHKRRKIVEELITEFHNYHGDFQIMCSNRHLVFIVPPMQSESSPAFILESGRDKEKDKDPNVLVFSQLNKLSLSTPQNNNFYNEQAASIFTYRPSKKLIDSYIFKKSFKYTYPNKFIMEKFIYFLLQQRLKENFSFLNSNTKGIILVTKISVSKVKNIDEFEHDKIIFKRCLMLYIMQLSPNKEELQIEFFVEPVSGYYMFKFSDKEAKIFDERNLNNSLTNYYKTIDKEIFESVKNFNYLIRETILNKLNRESNHRSSGDGKYIEKKPVIKSNNLFSHKNIKKDTLYISYLCFANEQLKKNQLNLIDKIESFEKDLKEFYEETSDDTIGNKYGSKIFTENMKNSLELIKEIEYKILEKNIEEKEFTYLEKIIVDRFYSFFYDLFNYIMDSKFEDDENCSYYAKIISKTNLIVIRLPSIDRLLNCCKNQSGTSHQIVIHLKFYILSIERLKQTEKKFAEILSERSSLKTVQLNQIENEVYKLNSKNNSKMSFWDDSTLKDGKDNQPFNYAKNEWFDMCPTVIINNLMNLIEHFYQIIYNKNNMITLIENNDGKLENILKENCSFDSSFDINDILESMTDHLLFNIEKLIENKILENN